MKNPLVIFRGRSFLDIVGLLTLLLLFGLNAFHFNISQGWPFYREVFAVLFAVLWFLSSATHAGTGRGVTRRVNRSLFYLLLFPALLVIWSLGDLGVPLYGDLRLEQVSEHLSGRSATLYVLRNALLYIPMVLYVSQRGLNEMEIRLIALVAIVLAPLSINAYLQSYEFATLGTLGHVAEMGGGGIAYNTYVPYLTFPVLCGVYLLFASGARVLKGVILVCVLITAVFVLFSTSRQSVLFMVLTLAVFLHFRPNYRAGVRRWLLTGAVGLVGLLLFRHLTQDVHLADEFLKRFGSFEGFFLDATSRRGATALEGLRLLEPWQWFSGAGLTCVITSGPHNDYVRWTQRVGLILMVIGFLPFIRAFRISYWQVRRGRRHWQPDNSLSLFLMLAVGFPLFHSLFCYPREEANQAVAVYLGLALWFGALRTGLLSYPWEIVPSVVEDWGQATATAGLSPEEDWASGTHL